MARQVYNNFFIGNQSELTGTTMNAGCVFLAEDTQDFYGVDISGDTFTIGGVTKVGTPVDNQVGIWTGDGTIEGTSGLTYNNGNLTVVSINGVEIRANETNTTFIGTFAGENNIGDNSTGLGVAALSNGIGNGHTAIGNLALQFTTGTSVNLTAIGANSSVGSVGSPIGFQNSTSLGASSNITKSNQVTLGDLNTEEVLTSGLVITGGYTVGTLPTGVLGARAYVTDATAPTYLNILTGGGAITCPVFYDGTNWVST